MISKYFLRFIRFGIPFYQSSEELGISGSRDTVARFERYGLVDVLEEDMVVLDIGCNIGFFSMYTSRFVKHVDAFDNKWGNVFSGWIARRALGLKNVRLFRSSVERFVASRQYDVVFSFAIHHWISLSFREYAQRLVSFVKPGGYLVFESHDLAKLDEDFSEKVALLEELGFVVVKRVDMRADGNRECVILRFEA